MKITKPLMTNKKLEQQILEKIKKEKIKPRPKVYFVIKNSFFISLFFISTILGAISFSVIFYIFSNDQSILNYFNLKYLKNGIFFWLLILIFFIFLALKNSKQIKNSYRYSWNILLLVNLSISIILGFVFFNFGLGKITDQLSSQYLDFYKKNIKITEIKKDIFLKKLKEIGITNEILEQYPELKDKVKNKFNSEVLGKNYFDNCIKPYKKCPKNEVYFEDENGCGCRILYK